MSTTCTCTAIAQQKGVRLSCRALVEYTGECSRILASVRPEYRARHAPVDVAGHGLGEVVVDHTGDVREVDSWVNRVNQRFHAIRSILAETMVQNDAATAAGNTKIRNPITPVLGYLLG